MEGLVDPHSLKSSILLPVQSPKRARGEAPGEAVDEKEVPICREVLFLPGASDCRLRKRLETVRCTGNARNAHPVPTLKFARLGNGRHVPDRPLVAPHAR